MAESKIPCPIGIRDSAVTELFNLKMQPSGISVGKLYGYKDDLLKIGWITWFGNNNVPTPDTYTMTISQKWASKIPMAGPVRDGDFLQIDNNTVSLKLLDYKWSNGVLCYPLA